MFAVKFNPDGSVARLKIRLVAKCYAEIYGVDYSITFSPVAKLTYVRLFISLVAYYDWNLYQLDIRNVFLHGYLQEEVYMEQPSGFVAQGGDREGVSSSKIFVCFETKSPCLVWQIQSIRQLRHLACRKVSLTTLSSIRRPVLVLFY